ncbi:hypothetical protein O181_010875 [Austropuccinia psidii MF-1]|uniref:Uncharacterized protein n=1 Tax=Austropuccinia psidii MF-1 TaxID=1389203 RepID=A0A9Q3GLC8_9BASI|nr:hypothetical protein [Austropuccinia psidii MF-1]
MEFIRGIEMIKEDFELPDKFLEAIFNTLFTNSAYRWYNKLKQAHGHQSWTWSKTKIINKLENYSWRFIIETAFESAKFNSDKEKPLPWFCQQKDRLTELYPEIPDFMIHRNILIKCGGEFELDFQGRTTEKFAAEDIINMIEKLTTRNRIGSSRVDLQASSNEPCQDCVNKNPQENSNNMNYKSANTIRKWPIF